MGYRSFEDLEVWKRSCRLAVRLYRELQEYIRFIHIAKGSAAELRTQLYIAGEIGLLDKSITAKLTAELKEISAMLQSITCTLKKRLNGSD